MIKPYSFINEYANLDFLNFKEGLAIVDPAIIRKYFIYLLDTDKDILTPFLDNIDSVITFGDTLSTDIPYIEHYEEEDVDDVDGEIYCYDVYSVEARFYSFISIDGEKLKSLYSEEDAEKLMKAIISAFLFVMPDRQPSCSPDFFYAEIREGDDVPYYEAFTKAFRDMTSVVCSVEAIREYFWDKYGDTISKPQLSMYVASEDIKESNESIPGVSSTVFEVVKKLTQDLYREEVN